MYYFRNDHFWQAIPAWKNISAEEFKDHKWQSTHAIINLKRMKEVLQELISNDTIEDIEDGLKKAPMNLRITPYLFSLINWEDVANDPIRKQFIPLGSQFLPEHPFSLEDSLCEDADSPVPLLTHRYPDKVLFLPLTVCPTYCSFCTRSRLIGGATESKNKIIYGPHPKEWERVYKYLADHPAIEDVVISGGDAYQLAAHNIEDIGMRLLKIPNIRRIRYATKGLDVMPMKILSDGKWLQAVKEVSDYGRSIGKKVAIHSHFNHPNEITDWTKQALDKLYSLGLTVRNQTVLIAGVNDNPEVMKKLIKHLSYINIDPYYIYIHDMVSNCEHFRNTVREAVNLANIIQGCTSGYHTPRVVCDAPGGGGKRIITSYQHYDEFLGVSVWKAPTVKPNQVFYYYDPIHKLSPEAQKIWQDPKLRQQKLSELTAKLSLPG